MSAEEAISLIRSCLPRVRTADGTAAESAGLGIEGSWQGSSWSGRLRNAGPSAVRVKEIVLFAGRLPCPPETGLYAEGFQKLSQYCGTLAAPVCLGTYNDRDHCRLPQTPGAFTVYNLLLLSPPGGGFLLMAAASCRRFSAEFRIFPDQRVELVLDAESRPIRPGAQWDLEEFFAQADADREDLLGALAERIQHNHPRLPYPRIPAGWCSWYHYYADVTEGDILANLDAISARIPALKYVQIDDGFQARMGDWLTPGTAFSGGVRRLCEQIRARGFEPALWVAPFIAEEDSAVFREHPDWFISDDSGKPLRSDLVSYGGWRRAPWYALDGTHPRVQDHFEALFRSLRTDWGCSYFKLDANFWGALHGGRFHDPEATRVEAYRRGMEAVLRGAGDAFDGLHRFDETFLDHIDRNAESREARPFSRSGLKHVKLIGFNRKLDILHIAVVFLKCLPDIQ